MLVDKVIVNAAPRGHRLLWAFAGVVVIAACGSRSGLLVTGPNEEPGPPQGEQPAASGDDGGSSSPADAAVRRDALPPIDALAPAPTVMNDCPDAAATLVYLVSQKNVLMTFYPPAVTFTTIGTISCPASQGLQPFSMAVDRTGIAYVLFADNGETRGELFRVSTATASCRPTGFVSGQQGFAATFGMAFVKDLRGGGETLYVAEGGPLQPGASAGGGCGAGTRLASVNTNTFALNLIGTVNPVVCSPELTGTGAGSLFGFYALDPNDSAIGQINLSTARLTSESRLAGVALLGSQGPSTFGAWAFGFWGGDFYTFTDKTGTGSVVTRFRPTDGSVATVGQTTETIVGAGVSTCAPQQ